MSAVSNEQVKLTAGLLNTVAGFSITAGGVGPLIAISYGLNAPPAVTLPTLSLIAAIWFAIGISLHTFARRMLRRLQP